MCLGECLPMRAIATYQINKKTIPTKKKKKKKQMKNPEINAFSNECNDV